MIKTIEAGDRTITFSTAFAWMYIYRSQFGRDPAKVVVPAIQTALQATDDGTQTMVLLSELGFTEIINISWACAKAYDKTTPPPEDWVAQYGEDMPAPLDLLQTVIVDVITACFATKKA